MTNLEDTTDNKTGTHQSTGKPARVTIDEEEPHVVVEASDLHLECLLHVADHCYRIEKFLLSEQLYAIGAGYQERHPQESFRCQVARARMLARGERHDAAREQLSQAAKMKYALAEDQTRRLLLADLEIALCGGEDLRPLIERLEEQDLGAVSKSDQDLILAYWLLRAEACWRDGAVDDKRRFLAEAKRVEEDPDYRPLKGYAEPRLGELLERFGGQPSEVS
ncbi:MAG: hypothetical protein AAF604_15455 [Acidobacteriota bacterium]